MIHFDKLGIIGQPDHRYPSGIEGGDSMNWMGHYNYLTDYPNVINYTDNFESKQYPGLYVRHPNPAQSKHGFASYCEGNWRGVESRDQMTGKLCFFVKAKAYQPLKRSLVKHCKRGMIFANNTIHNGINPLDYGPSSILKLSFKLPDITLFDIWALYIRGFRFWALYPLLILFDLQLLVTACIKYFSSDNDIISFVLKVITARETMPTPLGWLASKISSSKAILNKLSSYWTGWRQQPGMYDLYISYVKRYWR